MSKLEGEINMKTVERLNELLKFLIELKKSNKIDYMTFCIFQTHLASIMDSVVEVYDTKEKERLPK